MVEEEKTCYRVGAVNSVYKKPTQCCQYNVVKGKSSTTVLTSELQY